MGGVLYQNDANTGDKRLVLPKSLQEQAMRLNHGLLSAGHQGIIHTKERMKEKSGKFLVRGCHLVLSAEYCAGGLCGLIPEDL